MKKIKILSTTVIMILLGISFTSVNGAEELAGSIDVDLKDWSCISIFKY